MRVLEILNSYPGETFLQEHAKAVVTNSEVKLSWAFWQSGKPGPYAKKVMPQLEHCIGLINPNRISRLRKALLKLRYGNDKDAYTRALISQVKRIQPDVIHFQFASLALRHYQWVEALGIPFTFSIRGADIQSEVTQSQASIDVFKKMVEKSNGIHTVCDHLKNKLFEICGENSKTTTIRTVINEHWKEVKRNPVHGQLVSIGRLHWRKNYADLLLACSSLKKNGHTISLTIIGEGEQRTMLEFMIRDLGLKDVVKLVGRLDAAQIKNHLERADVFVLSSVAEGFPNVVGEAAFAKVPLIATADTFVTEVFEQNREVLVVPTATPLALAQGIEQLLALDSLQRKALTGNAFEKASTIFSSAVHADLFVRFWQKILIA